MKPEMFRKIAGFPLYEISNYGELRSWNTARRKSKHPFYMKLTKNKTGYLFGSPRSNSKKRKSSISRLVLEAFFGPCPEDMECCHNNGIRDDNRLENLRWDTRKNNNADKIKHGTKLCGETAYNAKLKNIETIEIRRLASKKVSRIMLGKMFKVSTKTIYCIVTRKTWKHI